jgi:hypothetical protein
VTPPAIAPALERAIVGSVATASAALGLRHGPIHAECRVTADSKVFVLEVAARPIGGLCARALRLVHRNEERTTISLEELLLRHALGESPNEWRREAAATGVMMVPIPRRGIFRRVNGVDQSRAIAGVEDVRITAKSDQLLLPLPEGASYLGFIFARGTSPGEVTEALRRAHECLQFTIDPEVPVLQSRHG